MAYPFYVTVEGVKQGVFKGRADAEPVAPKVAVSLKDNNRRPKAASRIVGYEFLSLLEIPRDPVTNQASGKRRYQPITFVKRWGSASPQLFQAAVTNEVLKSVLFEFVRPGSDGAEEVFFTIKLLTASISTFKQYIGDVQNSVYDSTADNLELENIAFVFKTIEIAHKDGTASQDDVLH